MSISKKDQLYKNDKVKKRRQRKCDECRKWYTPTEDDQRVCGTDCAIAYVPKKMAKRKRKAIRQFRAGDKAQIMRDAQKHFNKYIRLRDKDLPCISCGHMDGLEMRFEEELGEYVYFKSPSATNRQRHAGHYRPVGRNSQLRFNEDNCHSQCSICNNHLSGNLVLYREALILKIGIGRVIKLEEDNEPKRYTVEQLKAVIKTVKEKTKSLV